ncbi:MAG: MMPL family transporter [Thermoanaerobaculia bacterium]|nr:MMPL family transporter [Thermoanaerobaculia bacterium]
MRGRYLQRIALYGRRHYHRIFLAAGLLVALALTSALRLHIDSDVLSLLPRNEPVVDTFRSTLEEFGGVDLLLLLVEVPEGAAVDPYEAYVERLANELEKLPHLEYVDYRIGDIEELVRSYFPSSFLFLDEAGRRAFEEKLSEQGIRDRVAEIRRLLATPQAIVLKQLIRLDPLGLADVFVSSLSTTRGALRVDLTSGFFLSADHRLILLMAKPVQPAQEIEFTRQLVAEVEGRIGAASAAWGDIVADDEDPPPPPVVEIGGNYLTALEDAGTIRRDVIVNVVTSMGGVLLLFLFAFRRIGLLMYAFVPLFTGLILTYGFTGVTVGVLNAASGAFAALLVGLGIDFVIVSYGRYVEEREKGRRIATALRIMAGSCGRAVLIGGVTSAATFYAFTGTKFIGLRQMGLLTGTGILLCMAAVIFLLPSMLAWSEDHHTRRRRETRLFLHGFGSARVVRLCMRRPLPVLALGAVLTLVMGGLALRLRFEDSIREMRPQGNRAAAIEERMARHFGSGFDFMMLVLRGDSLEEVLELTADAGERLDAVAGSEELVRYESIASILPPSRRQQETLAWLAEHRDALLDPERIRSVFDEAATAEGLRSAAFAEGLDLLAEAASVDRPISLGDLVLDDSSRRLLERFVHEGPEGWTSIVYLYPPPTIWKRTAPPGLRRVAEEMGDRVALSGVNVVSEFLRVTVKRDAIIAAIVGFVLVAILLWFDFRSFLDALLSLAPLTVGLVWMLGGMVLIGQPMNFFNIFVSTMIIGIGVDYGIHMTHRYRECRDESRRVLENGLVETGKAIVLAAMSTMVGFGSLSLSSYPGLRSIGYVAILGAFSTALVAISLLPAYLAIRLHRADAMAGATLQQSVSGGAPSAAPEER